MKKTIVIILLFLPCIDLFLIFSGRDLFEYQSTIGTILLALEISYLLFGFGKVEIDEKGAKCLFGKPIQDLDSGLYYILPGIESVRKEKKTRFNDELPAEPEKIYRGDKECPKGMFPPIRVKFGQPDPKDEKLKDDPYNAPMVTEVVPVVNWHIEKLSEFLQTAGSIENFRAILQDKTIEVFSDDFSKVTPAKALLKLDETSQKIEEKLIKETNGMGITINDAYVKPFIFSHGLNDAVVGVSKARENAKATILTAGAEKTKRIEEGTGIAEAEKLLLEARAIGTQKLAEICKTDEGKITLWMNTLSESLKNSKYSIIPGGELFSSIAGIKLMLDKIKGDEK